MTTSARSSSTAARSEAAGRRQTHCLYGLTLASEFPFDSRLEPGRGPADLVFTLSTSGPEPPPLGEPVFASPFEDAAGDSISYLYRLPEGELLRFDGALDFYLGERAIHCHLRDASRRYLVELRLLGPVLAYWLERRAVRALHASAVVVDGRAIAFMGANRGGKSGLAAALMVSGRPLLSDDLLPIEVDGGAGFRARPGYPQMRMWPDQVAQFVGQPGAFPRVHPRESKLRIPVGEGGLGHFHPRSAALSRIYLPQRRPAERGSREVRIESLSQRRAMIELVRCSFSPLLVEAAGLQPDRLELFARLVQAVPVRRLVYPSGLELLSEVGRAVLADCAAP